MDHKVIVELRDVSVAFDGEKILDNLSLAIRDKEFVTFLGASGCGKSTLLNMIAGVLSPTVGTIQIDGTDMTAASQKEKDKFRIEKIGYIFQGY